MRERAGRGCRGIVRCRRRRPCSRKACGSSRIFLFEKLLLKHRRFDGGWSEPLSREILHIPRAVCVLPYDPASDSVVLIEQFRTGALTHEGGPWMIECVAGLMEEGEETAETARREVREEAGLEVQELVRIGVYAPSPGAVTERTTMYIARVDASVAGGVHGLAEEHEDIRVHVVGFDRAIELVDAERITCANAQLCLRWLQLHIERIRAEWLGTEVSESS
ncbi:MAG: NUDIX domain-containing protein [Geminicoccaceae bacterium]